MLYGDDVGIMKNFAWQLLVGNDCGGDCEGMPFGLTVSEVKTEIICLHGKDTPRVEFSVHAACQIYK